MSLFQHYRYLLSALLLGVATHLSAMGFFTIADGERVQFASGNVQYNYGTSSYQLAPNQYDTIGIANVAAITGGTGVRDLIQWSELSAITAAGFRVLTEAEWHYLFTHRPHCYELFALSTVAGVKGVVILPDYDIWTEPDGVDPFDYYNTHEGFDKNVYTADQWELMEEAGALFIPAAGYMHKPSSYKVEDVGGHGAYWSNTEYEYNTDQAYRVQFDDGTGGYFYELGNFPKSNYYSVRTVGAAPLLLSENDQPDEFNTKMTTARGQSDIWVQRTLRKVGSLNTLTLPFDVPVLSDSPLKGAEVYEFRNATVENGKLYLNISKVTELTAGVPYLIQWSNTGDTIKSMHFNVSNWDDDNTALSVGGPDVIFHGFYGRTHVNDKTDVDNIDHANLFVGANNKLYWPIDGNDPSAKMYGFRAYFEVRIASSSGGSGMRRRMKQSSGIYRGMPAEFRIIEEVNTATDLGEVQSTKDNVPCTKVMRNGQLIIIRNNTEYNISGQIIKQND